MKLTRRRALTGAAGAAAASAVALPALAGETQIARVYREYAALAELVDRLDTEHPEHEAALDRRNDLIYQVVDMPAANLSDLAMKLVMVVKASPLGEESAFEPSGASLDDAFELGAYRCRDDANRLAGNLLSVPPVVVSERYRFSEEIEPVPVEPDPLVELGRQWIEAREEWDRLLTLQGEAEKAAGFARTPETERAVERASEADKKLIAIEVEIATTYARTSDGFKVRQALAAYWMANDAVPSALAEAMKSSAVDSDFTAFGSFMHAIGREYPIFAPRTLEAVCAPLEGEWS